MPGAFQGISTMASALEAFQTQLDVTGQNISNVETPGYSRETVNLKSADPTLISVGAMIDLGNGVSITGVNRIRDMFLQGSSVAANSDLGKADAQSSAADSINTVILDPSANGLSNDLTAFFNAWSGLASNPSSSSAQLAVQQAGQNLANDVSGTYNGLQGLQQTQSQQVTSTLTSIQNDLNQIASLNSQIATATAMGASPNTAMDQRDQAVQDLSSMMNVDVVRSSSGAYLISSGGAPLVDQGGARTLPTTFNAATSTLSGGSGPAIVVKSGKLAGLFDSMNKLTSYQGSLDTLANQLRSQVNGAYANAVTPAGTGALFFNSGSGAASLDLDATGLAGPPVVKGVKNDPTAIAPGSSGNASDGTIAQQIAGIATQQVAGLGNQTMGAYYGQLVDQIGTDGQNAKAAQSTQQAVNQQITAQIQSSSGVNLDEEMTTLLRFQRSYQAAAQAVTAMDQVTQNLLAMTQGL